MTLVISFKTEIERYAFSVGLRPVLGLKRTLNTRLSAKRVVHTRMKFESRLKTFMLLGTQVPYCSTIRLEIINILATHTRKQNIEERRKFSISLLVFTYSTTYHTCSACFEVHSPLLYAAR